MGTPEIRWGVSATLAFGVIGYWIAAPLLPLGGLMEILHAAVLGIAVTVSLAYGPSAWDAFRDPKPSRAKMLIIGIFTTWVAALGAGVWVSLWRIWGKPSWMIESCVTGFILFLVLIGGMLHITAPRTIDGEVPKRHLILIGVAAGLAVFIAVTFYYARTNAMLASP